MKTVLLVAGDPSGDLHGASLIRALKQADPGIKVAAVGGRLMRDEADEFLFDLASMGVTGFWEPIKTLPVLVRLLRTLKAFMRSRRPTVVCIDYYGFNRRVLGAAKSEGLTTYYYISPQVWASRPGRLKALRRLVDRMLVIFPFEEEFYRKAKIPVTFVGHPLLDLIPEPSARTESGSAPLIGAHDRQMPRHEPPPGELRVGLLPGSRLSEVRRHLPIFLDAVERIRKDYPALVPLVFAAAHLPDKAYAQVESRGARLVRDSGYRLRSGLDLALTSSGTATLENTLLGVPMVVIYRMSWPTYAVARSLIRVRHISMANLLAGKTLVPELIQRQATAPKVARAALDLLGEPRRLDRVRAELLTLRYALGGPGAAGRAAKIILQQPPVSGPAEQGALAALEPSGRGS